MIVPKTILDADETLHAWILGGALSNIPEPPPDSLGPPFGIPMALMTSFGLNWDGGIDEQDSGRGAWGADTRNPALVGCALPQKLLQATFGSTESSHIVGYTLEIYSQVTQQTIRPVDIVDIGPAAWTHRLVDGTYGLHKALGHIDHGLALYGQNWKKWPAGFHVAYWIISPSGKAVEIKGVDFAGGRIIGS